MRSTQEAAMMDTCMVMPQSEAVDAIGHPVESWADGALTKCGLDPTGGQELRGTDKTVVRWDARIRLPLGTAYEPKDRIKMVRRFGQICDEIIYEIIGPADIGPSGLLLPLRKVSPSA
jgi:hypothetical protein